MSVDELQIEGYRLCGCSRMVPIAAFEVQGGKCWECLKQAPAIAELREIEILHRGVRVPVAKTPKKHYGSRGSQRKKKSVESAKRSALRRLRMLYPDVYDLLYDEERANRGLQPLPRPWATPHEVTAKTCGATAAYAAPIDHEGHPE